MGGFPMFWEIRHRAVMARDTFRPDSPATPTGVRPNSTAGRSPALAVLVALRPSQWTKNFILFAGLLFGGKLLDSSAVITSMLAFAVFCILSGVVYLVNDVRDVDADRAHPTKSRRPIAAGDLSIPAALTWAVVLAAAALGGRGAGLHGAGDAGGRGTPRLARTPGTILFSNRRLDAQRLMRVGCENLRHV